MNVGAPRTLAHSWLLLIHQLPAKPAYFRVKIWRRLQDLGAIAVKNAVHALPMNEETKEDFEWLLRESRPLSPRRRRGGASGPIMFTDGLSGLRCREASSWRA